MTILAEPLDPVIIRAQSPDKTVRASLTYHEGLLVRVKPGTIAGATAAGLAEQITEAVNRALRGFRTASDNVFEREYGAAALELLIDTEPGRALRPRFEALGSLAAEATGDREAVTVEWRARSCRVMVHEHAMFGNETALASDLNQALAQAQLKFAALAADLLSQPDEGTSA